MAAPRRHIIRPALPIASDPKRQRQLQRLRARLQSARDALDRWWKRLRRALNAVEKQQKSVKSLERQLAQDGGGANGQGN